MAKSRKAGRKNPRGTKKGDKIHGQKKGKKGEAAAYMTRAQALAKLQLPLADFRKICILKGIYPRDPKKKAHGMDKTYYHNKDILFLAHEPLMNKFFELKTFMKKFKRLMGRNERTLAISLEERKPTYVLHHLVRERYPSFNDAVRDLDDAVSMLALFQALSTDQKREIPAEAVNEATRLYQEFQLFVIRAQALRKVFASIKGYYFQAEICGQSVTWLAPHQFSQNLPQEVDFRVMLTFLEFFRAMVKFVNFKLYADLGLAYPPKRDTRRDAGSAEVAALEVEMREAGEGRKAQADAEAEEGVEAAAEVAAEFGENSEEARAMQLEAAKASKLKNAFRGCRVFVSREVPLRPIYFALLCGGADEVGWERGSTGGSGAGEGSAFAADDAKVTHHIVDRPPDSFEQRPGREYVQPQWVFDSFNTGCQLPIAPYAPGRAPPPHLSPFVDDKAEGYVPRQREVLDRFAAEAAGVAVDEAGAKEAGVGGEQQQAASFGQFQEELKAEASGVWHAAYREKKAKEAAKRMEDVAEEVETEDAAPEVKKAKKKAKKVDVAQSAPVAEKEDSEEEGELPAQLTPEEEERQRRKTLMPKKHKRLLQRIEKGEQLKKDQHSKLAKKRRQADKAK